MGAARRKEVTPFTQHKLCQQNLHKPPTWDSRYHFLRPQSDAGNSVLDQDVVPRVGVEDERIQKNNLIDLDPVS
jgi:hypothetical protein